MVSENMPDDPNIPEDLVETLLEATVPIAVDPAQARKMLDGVKARIGSEPEQPPSIMELITVAADPGRQVFDENPEDIRSSDGSRRWR